MMSKFVNITVSTSLSTDFSLEVDDNATEDEIRELAVQEVILPHQLPDYIFKIPRNRLDSMIKSWNVDELTFIIDDEQTNRKS